jgi:V8-like Glu-specific endopeptidase
MKRHLILALLVVFDFPSGMQLYGQRSERDEKNLSLTMQVMPLQNPRRLQAASVLVPQTPEQTTSVRIHLRLINPGRENWSVLIQNSRGALLERIGPAAFVQAEYWTDEIPGGNARLSVKDGTPEVDVEVDSYAVSVQIAQPQGIIGPVDESVSIVDQRAPARAVSIAPAVARLKVVTPLGPADCTGFLVGSDLLLTNFHCISTNQEAAFARVELGVETPKPTQFKVIKIEASNRVFDYSLLRLSANASKFGRMYISTTDVPTSRLFLIEYPGGKIKKVAYPPKCAEGRKLVPGVDNLLNDFGHTCDTLGGSSGSPVLRWDDKLVVGLHHWNYEKDVEGSQNQAVRIVGIVADLKSQITKSTDPAKKNRLQAVLDEVLKQQP